MNMTIISRFQIACYLFILFVFMDKLKYVFHKEIILPFLKLGKSLCSSGYLKADISRLFLLVPIKRENWRTTCDIVKQQKQHIF